MGKKSFGIVMSMGKVSPPIKVEWGVVVFLHFLVLPEVLLLERVSASSVFTGAPSKLCLFAGSSFLLLCT